MTPLIGITLGAYRPSNSDNLFWRLRHYYTGAVENAGGAPTMIPLRLQGSTLRTIYDRLDALVISGGGDIDPAYYEEPRSPYVSQVDPQRDQQELQLIRWAVEDNKPLLAICRGHQALNVSLGGTLYQDIGVDLQTNISHDHHGENWFEILVHPVIVETSSRLSQALAITEPLLTVNSLHHQAVKRLGAGLVVSARAEDGVIEGVELPEHRFALGVQWHPEALVAKEPAMHNLFASLIKSTYE